MEYRLTLEEYNATLKQTKLLGLKCESCGAVMARPRLACEECGLTDIVIVDFCGSSVTQTLPPMSAVPEGREADSPYIVALIGLDQGLEMVGSPPSTAAGYADMKSRTDSLYDEYPFDEIFSVPGTFGEL